MKILRKQGKRILSMFLVTIMVFTIMAIPASAAGVETFDKGTHYLGTYTFSNTNLTPVKTVNGTRIVVGQWFTVRDSYTTPFRLTVQIREYGTGKILASGYQNKVSTKTNFELALDVTYGKKIQIWTDAGNSNGAGSPIRSAEIESYVIVS